MSESTAALVAVMTQPDTLASPERALDPVRPAAAQPDADVPYPASLGRRFGNSIIDGFALGGVVVALSSAGLAEPLAPLAGGWGIEILMYLLVYVLPEALWGRTLGKLCTGTKVINANGGKASVGQVLARTAIRLVPFDAISFLWGDATGWHDSWSKTQVVPLVEPYSDV